MGSRRGYRQEVRFVDSDSPSPKELHFHYRAEEREQTRRRERPGTRGGVLRGNRSLTILLIDVVLVLLLFGVWYFVLREDPWRGSLVGSEARLELRRQEDYLVARLEVEGTSEAIGGRHLEARFVASRDGKPIDAVSYTEVTPEEGRRRIFRAELSRKADRVDVELSGPDKSIKLWRRPPS